MVCFYSRALFSICLTSKCQKLRNCVATLITFDPVRRSLTEVLEEFDDFYREGEEKRIVGRSRGNLKLMDHRP